MFMDSMDSPSIGAWQELLQYMWNASMMSCQLNARQKKMNNILWSKPASTYMQKRHQQWQMFRVTCSKWRCQCLDGLATNHLDTTRLVPMKDILAWHGHNTLIYPNHYIHQWHQSNCIFNWNKRHWLELCPKHHEEIIGGHQRHIRQWSIAINRRRHWIWKKKLRVSVGLPQYSGMMNGKWWMQFDLLFVLAQNILQFHVAHLLRRKQTNVN